MSRQVYSGRSPLKGPGLKGFGVVWEVVNGRRPTRPEALKDDSMWRIIQACWAHNPHDRPDMLSVAQSLC